MPEHGDADKTANSGRGIHGIFGFSDVADEAARALIVQTVADVGRVVRQTGGNRPGAYRADGAGAWAFMGEGKWWEAAEFVTASQAAKVGVLQIVSVGSSSDVVLTLPPIASVKEGDIVPIIATTGGSAAGARVIIRGDTATEIIGGFGVTTTSAEIHFQANFEYAAFIAIPSFGGWIGVPWSGPDRERSFVNPEATRAITEPLPAFTPSIVNTHDLRLTANANGQLVIDGVGVNAGGYDSWFEGVLVAGETGTNRQYHGIYSVEQAGDGSNPWILRRRSDQSHLPGCARAGMTIRVRFGLHGGSVFRLEGGSSVTAERDFEIAKSEPYVFSHAQITSDQNDFEPTNYERWRFGDVHRINADAPRSITGFIPSPYPRRLINTGSQNITLQHEGGGSAVANRILIAGASPLVIGQNAAVDLWYDFSSSRWRVV